MAPATENPAALGASRASEMTFCSAAEQSEDSRSPLPSQARTFAGVARGFDEASRIKRQRASASEGQLLLRWAELAGCE